MASKVFRETQNVPPPKEATVEKQEETITRLSYKGVKEEGWEEEM